MKTVDTIFKVLPPKAASYLYGKQFQHYQSMCYPSGRRTTQRSTVQTRLDFQILLLEIHIILSSHCSLPHGHTFDW